MGKRLYKSALFGSGAAILLIFPGASFAQEATQPDSVSQLDEVVVTAQKRSENVQDVPLAVSAVGGQALDRLGVQNPLVLGAAVPNLSLQNNSGATYIYLRGVGNNFLGLGVDSNVAYHSNGVYVARPRAQVASYFDTERIEVVRGPQGDLYGRNATGGSINVISRRPTDVFAANASITAGNYDLVQVEAGVGGPVVGDTIKARLAGYTVDRGGYGRNEATGRDIDDRQEWGGRLTVEADPNDRVRFEVIADIFNADDAWGVVHQAGRGRPDTPTLAEAVGNTPTDIRNIVSGIDPNRNIRAWGVQASATWDVNEWLSLKSISAYRDSRYTSSDELIGTSPSLAEITQLENQSQFSQEIQVLANGANWDFIGGVYYFHEAVDGFVHIPLFFAPGAQFDQRGDAATDAYAVFAHGSWAFTDQLKLIVGARYSHENRDSTGTFIAGFGPIPTGGEKAFSAFTPKITLQYEPRENISIYAGASQGFHSGGFTIGVPGPGTDEETLWSYEAGLKAQFFDRRLTANLAAFYYDYKDLVVTRIVGAQTLDENAAAAIIKGFEAEITARPMDGLRLDLTLGLLDPTYDSYVTSDAVRPELGVLDLSGNQLPGASKYTARLGAQYDFDLGNGTKVTVNGDAVFSGETYFSSYEQKNAYQEAYGTYNASISYDSGAAWSATLWGRNLSDETIVANQVVSANFWGFPRLTYLRDPRTFGVDLRLKY